MGDLSKDQQLKLITDHVESVRHSFFRDIEKDFTPETKTIVRHEVLSELVGIRSTVFFVFGRECTAYEAAEAAWNDIHAVSFYS